MLREQHHHAINSINLEQITNTASLLISALKNGNKILICGCGGSAADAQHFSAELVGRYRKKRLPLACIALTTDTSIITSVANDFSFVEVFSHQVMALGREGDVLIAISTSGNSEVVLRAITVALDTRMVVIGLTGNIGMMGHHDIPQFRVNGADTARIQEGHEFILHCLAQLIDEAQ